MNDDEYTEVITTFVEMLLGLEIPAGDRPSDYIFGVLANVSAGVICHIVMPGDESKAVAALTRETTESLANLIQQIAQHRSKQS